MLVLFELLEENDIFAGHEKGGGQEIILVGFLRVSLLIEPSLVFLEILAECILAAELIPASEVVDFGLVQDSLFEHPIYLLLLAPHHVPVVSFNLSPLPGNERLVNAISERCFKFYC